MLFNIDLVNHAIYQFEHVCRDSMKKLQGDCVSWLVLLTGAAQLLLVCGEGMFNHAWS